ncbi:PEP-CTERM sorting domain-containing protein [Planctomycetota bacterium]|nr:PEP-CTERM sorting domain-containing protein [Planctomycetota bacterium]
MLRNTGSFLGCAVVLAVAGQASGDIVEGAFSGASFWVDGSSQFGMGNSTGIAGSVQFNSDEIFGNVASNNKSVILIGDFFTQPGFDFDLNMGSLSFSRDHISHKELQNSATLQFDIDGDKWSFEGLFAQLDFSASGKDYRLEQSGFTWEIKERNPDGSTTLKPTLVSGYWNYGELNITNLNKPKPVADAGGDYIWTASDFFLNLDGSGSNSPDPDPLLYVNEYKWTVNGNEFSGVNPQLGSFDVGFASTTDSVEVSLAVKDSFGVWSETDDTATISYENTAPVIDSFDAVNTDEGLSLDVAFSDADLNAIFGFFSPDFESHDIAFYFGDELLGEGESVLLDFEKLAEVFGESNEYDLKVVVTDAAGESVSDTLLVPIAVPEPSALAIMGLAGLVMLRRKRA